MPTTRTRRTPQDRKPKSKDFSFTYGGKTYTLPPASVGAAKVKGRILRDAAMDESPMMQLRLGIAMLEACGAQQDSIDAMYDMGADEMSQTLQNWMNSRADGGATVPQS